MKVGDILQLKNILAESSTFYLTIHISDKIINYFQTVSCVLSLMSNMVCDNAIANKNLMNSLPKCSQRN